MANLQVVTCLLTTRHMAKRQVVTCLLTARHMANLQVVKKNDYHKAHGQGTWLTYK